MNTEERVAENPKLYRPIPTILITVFIYFASQLMAGILISVIPLIKGWNVEQASEWIQNNVWGTFAFVLLVQAITVLLIRWFLKRRKAGFTDIGINKPTGRYLGYALMGFAAYFVFYIVALVVVKAIWPGLNIEQKQEIGFTTSTTGISLLPVFISLVILPPLIEEIVARGFLFGGLRTKLPFVLAATITSVLFAMAHLNQASDGLLWVAGIDTFILSIVMCFLREKTGSLWPSIGVHMIKNGIAFVVLFNIVQYFR